MWLTLAFVSAALLGLYDVAKKRAVTANAVLPVLLCTTAFSAAFFLPVLFVVEPQPLWAHAMVFVKAMIVLTSWICGYFAIKHLPITTVGPINATRPVMVLMGAILIYGERLNLWQWGGVSLSIFSLFLLSRSSKKEGIDFRNNIWILVLFGAALSGAASGLYDKYVMRILEPLFVQSWYGLYQFLLMGTVVSLIWYPRRKTSTPFRWSWAIPLVSIFLSLADLAYYFALSEDGAMISMVSMVRRSSVVVSFAFGAILFGEKNLKSKALDLLFILIGMILLYIGTQQ
ncbi:MAG: DMT family transporter [Rikenellaceae bacterium]